MNATSLFLGLFLGSLGVGYFIYGKKTSRLVAMLCGVGLNILPWFVSSTPLLLLGSAPLLALPFLWKE